MTKQKDKSRWVLIPKKKKPNVKNYILIKSYYDEIRADLKSGKLHLPLDWQNVRKLWNDTV
tara:strand:- start:2580 stop:2762 length:183 start_codon:yes stop_codon:yes gene_type:complete